MELDILGLDILGRTFSILVVAVYHNLLLTFLGLIAHFLWTVNNASIHIGSEPKELLMELKLLADVLDHLESSLMSVGTQVCI